MAAEPFRLGRALIDGRPAIVVGTEDTIAPLSALLGGEPVPDDLLELIADWDAWRARIAAADMPGGQLEAEPMWLAPVMPPKLLCIGANYQKHNREMLGEVTAAFPYTFLKPPSTTVVASGDRVPMPSYAHQVDYEAELAAVMATAGSVFGYTILNDLSVRDWVKDAGKLGIDWLMAKSFDRSAPTGPWVLPAEFVPDPQNLAVRLWVNGEIRQDGNTADMVFTVSECVEHIGRIVTLEPGDIIATGTPDGVGMGTGRYLSAGDEIRIEIEGLGTQQTHMTGATAGEGGR